MAGEKRVQRLKSVLRKHGGEWRWLEATKMKLVVDREELVVVDCRHGLPGRLQDRLLVTTTSLKRLVLENGCCLVNWFNEKENDEIH
ncbi:hypothetical protein WN944_017525 [Citrus x changshan-huyou]|uniref:Uncharacterized protein n=1 Tax=Citrus x changshan-huyou TaxID=2935761 RepID=A0AAP0MGE7_9ROSI